jgi:hypothetical protein
MSIKNGIVYENLVEKPVWSESARKLREGPDERGRK